MHNDANTTHIPHTIGIKWLISWNAKCNYSTPCLQWPPLGAWDKISLSKVKWWRNQNQNGGQPEHIELHLQIGHNSLKGYIEKSKASYHICVSLKTVHNSSNMTYFHDLFNGHSRHLKLVIQTHFGWSLVMLDRWSHWTGSNKRNMLWWDSR